MMHRSYVDIPAGQVHVRRAGRGPRTILLLHQTAASSVMYESLVAPLTALAPDAELIALDTPGFGMSYRPDAPYSLDHWVDAVLAVLDTLGVDEVDVLGHHTGAAIALCLAARHPTRVRSLAMIGALGMNAEERAAWSASTQPMTIDPEGAHLQVAWTQVASIDLDPAAFPPAPALHHREVVDKLNAGERWHEAYLAVFAKDLLDEAARVTAPALLLCGTADVLRPYVPATIGALRDCRYVELDAGGYVLDQDPALVALPYASFLSSFGSAVE